MQVQTFIKVSIKLYKSFLIGQFIRTNTNNHVYELWIGPEYCIESTYDFQVPIAGE